jgi:hypothetical protein
LIARLRLTIHNLYLASIGDGRLDVIEKAIRSAFEKGDAEDKSFRERVYRSAFAALDRALQQNPNVTVEVAIKRRKALQAQITEIESEFIAPPSAAEAEPPPAAEPEPPPDHDPDKPTDFSDKIIGKDNNRERDNDPAARHRVSGPSEAAPVLPNIEPEASPEAAAAPAIEVVSPAAPPTAADEPVAPPVGMPWAIAPKIEAAENSGLVAEARPAQPADPSFRAEPSFDIGPGAPEPVAVERRENAEAPTPELVAVDRPSEREQTRGGNGPEAVFVDPDAAVIHERRRPYAAMFFAVTLFTAGAIGLWWAAETGLLKLDTLRDTSAFNPSKTIESEDFIPEDEEPVLAPKKPGETDALKNWISVFTPANATEVSAPSDASAEVMQSDEGQVLRIRSGASGSAVLFDVGKAVLEQIAGKHAIFDIVARAEEGSETQISVSCNFGDFGDCGRKRYAVGHERGEFLFEMELPAKDPGADGTIAISSDISNQGKAVDIYEIRVSVIE